MKRILITGLNSYVGNSLGKWLEKYPDEYSVDFISLRDNEWKDRDFAGYDVVFHVAGIAHIKETKENADLYFKVNRDLAYEFARKVKNDGVMQFIFLSSMSVYGIENGIIQKDTKPKPKSNYGQSKLEAEELIIKLRNNKFKVTIIRPPMIYGEGCRGNYPRLVSLSLSVPLFPDIKNKRSMIYIDNLSEFVRLLINEWNEGIFFPQNEEYICTSEIVKLIRKEHGKDTINTKFFNPLLRIFTTNTLKKVFSDLVYDKKMSNFEKKYCFYGLKDSIQKAESRHFS